MKNQNNIYKLLDLIQEKPQLYIGDKKLSTLCNNINGYNLYCLNNDIKENTLPKWEEFNDFVASELNYNESTSGYKNMILEKNNFNELISFNKFYELLKKFRNE
ncbi:hypothetical protein [Flavobacterium sp.]|uniref:hypothetical protein n=1 Tax=Flavobacterium sp. TaxID=239 RepID=UPI0028BF043C|nr:hypothetical protein [Flavobacterium sp.]